MRTVGPPVQLPVVTYGPGEVPSHVPARPDFHREEVPCVRAHGDDVGGDRGGANATRWQGFLNPSTRSLACDSTLNDGSTKRRLSRNGDRAVGEAKASARKQRDEALQAVEQWIAPTTDEELALANELSKMERVKVQRASAEELNDMQMSAQQCHDNCMKYKRMDPEGKSEVVLGWWFRDVAFVSHSVVRRDGMLFCVTPYDYDDDIWLDFVIDESIQLQEELSPPKISRKGAELPRFVRLEPEKLISECTWIRDRLISGMSVPRAFDMRDYPGMR